jgi:transporter family protein
MISALIAILLIGGGDAVSKKARLDGIPISRYLLFQSPVFSAIVLLIALNTGGLKLTRVDFLYSLVGGVLSFGAFAVMLHSLTRGQASTNYAIFRISFVFSSAAAVVIFHETISPMKIVGVVLAVCAILLFFGPGARATLTAVGAMAINAGFQLFLKAAARVVGSGGSFLFLMSLVFMVLTIIYNIAGSRDRLMLRATRYAIPNGILMGIGTLCVIGALAHGEASRVLPVVQLSFVITAAAAALFLGEKLTRLHLAGIVSAVLAIGLLALA